MQRGVRRRLPVLTGRAWWPWLLSLLLLQAQMLGQWHGVAHAGGPGPVVQAVADHDHGDHDHHEHHDHRASFGHAADDDAQCRLYDAVATAAGPCTEPALALVQAMAEAPRAAVPPPRAGRPDRPYEARAPPRA